MENAKVAVLEQRIEDMNRIILKLDDAIEKLSEVNSNVSKMLAVHEERITKQEEIDTVLFAKIDKLRDKIDLDHDGLLSRIQVIEKRVWIAIGIFYGLSFFQTNHSFIQKVLTSEMQASIIEHIDYKV